MDGDEPGLGLLLSLGMIIGGEERERSAEEEMLWIDAQGICPGATQQYPSAKSLFCQIPNWSLRSINAQRSRGKQCHVYCSLLILSKTWH